MARYHNSSWFATLASPLELHGTTETDSEDVSALKRKRNPGVKDKMRRKYSNTPNTRIPNCSPVLLCRVLIDRLSIECYGNAPPKMLEKKRSTHFFLPLLLSSPWIYEHIGPFGLRTPWLLSLRLMHR